MIFISADGGGFNHPFHLHGHDFHVMSMGYLEDQQLTNEAIANRIRANNFTLSSAPALKDTVIVPSSGYAVIRVLADNPGNKYTNITS